MTVRQEYVCAVEDFVAAVQAHHAAVEYLKFAVQAGPKTFALAVQAVAECAQRVLGAQARVDTLGLALKKTLKTARD